MSSKKGSSKIAPDHLESDHLMYTKDDQPKDIVSADGENP